MSIGNGFGARRETGIVVAFAAIVVFALLNLFGLSRVYAAGFVDIAPMNGSREYHGATVLASGKVLVEGGFGPLASAEIYDRASNSWAQTAPMAVARYLHTATLLQDGTVLVAGGSTGTLRLNSVERFNADTSSWSSAAPMATTRVYHTATLLPSGKVLVVGGLLNTAVATAELYDPVANTWTAAASMATPRYLHSASLLDDGRVLVAGGSAGDDSVTSAELYDPVTNSWSATGSMNIPRRGHSAVTLLSGRVMVVHGSRYAGNLASNEIYDPVTASWSLAASNANDRSGVRASLTSAGKVLMTGGLSSLGTWALAELYDPESNTWVPAGNLVLARYSHTSTLLPTGEILVSGGHNQGFLNSAELYAPATQTMVEFAPTTASVVGQGYTAMATVASESGAPHGSVSFADDQGATCGPAVLSDGTGSCTMASAVAGMREVTATFTPGDGASEPSSGSMSHEVVPALTAISLNLSPEPATTEQPVTATIALEVVAPGLGIPTGFVIVQQVDSGNSCTIELPELQCALPAIGSGTYQFEAHYVGDDNFQFSSTSAQHVVYNPYTEVQIVSVAPEPSVVGEPVSIFSSVTAVDGATTGTVTINAQTGESCSAAVAAGVCEITFFVDGPRNLTASYSGDAQHDPSQSSSVVHDVQDASTTTAIISDTPQPSVPFQAVTVSAQLSVNSPGSGMPHGGIYVTDEVDFCSIPEGGNSCELILQTRGPRTISATYSGDGDYAASSDQLIHNVNRLPIFGQPTYAVAENGVLTIDSVSGVLVGTTDPDGDTLSVLNTGSQFVGGIGGTLQIESTGAFVYTPPANTTGIATFGVTVSDGLEDGGGLATINVQPGLDLSITIDDGVDFVSGGGSIEYVIDLRNLGPSDATGASVHSVLPSNLINAIWECNAPALANCTGNGTGNIDDTVTIPSGAVLTYLLRADVVATPEVPVVTSVAVSAPSGILDTVPSNDLATDTDSVGIFRSGFD